MTVQHSHNRIAKAGERMREFQRGSLPLSPPDLRVELGVIEDFRADHSEPLARVAANLRYYVAECSDGRFTVGQRLKRMTTIMDKLNREPKMRLDRMHDIGGCRAVLPDQVAVDKVIERLQAQPRWDLLPRVYDYVDDPKEDGYRAKHLVARKSGVLIEIQLRTELQHAWAELVERIDRSAGVGLKAGRADRATHDALKRLSDTMTAFETGEAGVDRAAILQSLREATDLLDRAIS